MQLTAMVARMDHILLLASLFGANKDELMDQVTEVGQIFDERAWRKRGQRGSTRAPRRLVGGKEVQSKDEEQGQMYSQEVSRVKNTNRDRGACAAEAAHSGSKGNGDRGACNAKAAH